MQELFPTLYSFPLPLHQVFVTGGCISNAKKGREFLKATSVAAAAPYVITSAALGNAERPAASDRIVMGGIGIGNMGRGDLGAFLNRKDVQYVAVCDVREEVREKAKENVVERVDIEPATRVQDNGLRVVNAGLKGDEWVIVEGVNRTRPGGNVAPKDAPMPRRPTPRS